jgi:hypothetical protein
MRRVGNRLAAVVTTVAFVASICVTFAFGLALAPLAAGAATKGTDTVNASAAPGSMLAPHSHYYRIVGAPGSSVTQTVDLVNKNSHPIDVRVAGLDGYTSDATGAAYTTPANVAKGTGTWIVVSTPELTLQAGEPRAVDFTVQIPAHTAPGEYLAAVGMWVPLASTTTTQPGGNHAGFAVTLQGERVIAVEIIVPGPERASLVVGGVKAVAAPDGLRLQVAISNTGNAFTHGSGVITVADTKLDYPFDIDTFVSHTTIHYLLPWTRSVVPGTHQVSIKLTYDGGRVTTWNGAIVIAGALQRDLQTALHATQVGAPAPSRNWSQWLLTGGFVVLALCAAGAFWLRRRAASGAVAGRGPSVLAG